MVAPELHQKGRFPQGHLFEKIPTTFGFFSLWGNFQKSHFFGDLKAMLKWDRHLNMYVPRTFLLGTYLLMCSWLDPLRYYWQTEISGPQAKLFFQGLLAFFFSCWLLYSRALRNSIYCAVATQWAKTQRKVHFGKTQRLKLMFFEIFSSQVDQKEGPVEWEKSFSEFFF